MLVVQMVRMQAPLYAVMLKQMAGGAGVLRKDVVGLPEHLQGSQGDVVKIADGRGDDPEFRLHGLLLVMASLEELHELLQDGIVRWPLVAAMDNLQRTGQRGRLVYLLQGTLEERIITLKELVAKEKAIVDRQGSRH